MRIAKILATSALALGLEMTGSVQQGPTNPPSPIPPINPTPLPSPQAPGQQPKVELPAPSAPHGPTNPAL